MSRLGTVTFTSDSGNKYKFNVYSRDSNFKALAAVYFFTKRIKKSNGRYNHSKHVYVGQTKDLSERFDDHHKMPCIKRNGANSICIHTE